MRNDVRKFRPAVKIVIDAIKDSSSGSLLHACPYTGEHKANVTIKKSVVVLIPFGTYRISLWFHNDDDSEIFVFEIMVEMKAS